jgi:glycosidase
MHMKNFKNSLSTLLDNPVFRYLILVMLCLQASQSTALYAQDPPQYGTPFAGVPDTRDVNMYQVHIRPYSAAGNLAGVTARLDAIKALGTNVIYLMPIHPVGGSDPRDSNSPYAIRDFKAVAAEYGTLQDLRNLVDGAHSRGMAVIMDWVANQTSWSNPWITQHPDYYVRKNGVIQQLVEFSDVAALDFNSTAMRAAMVDAMRYWVFAANIDGFRCDFANNAPLDFWQNTISNLRGITSHKLLMFAEGDRVENLNAGFDMNFGDKWYYDAISKVAQGTSVAQLQTTTNTEYSTANSTQQVVRYTANHDTLSGVTPFSVFQNHNGVVANFMVSAYMRGVPFLTSGQEVDFNQTIPWPYTSTKIDWSANPGAAADFKKVLDFRTRSTAIRRGTMANYSDANVAAFTKISGTEKVVVMVNLRNNTSSYAIPAALAGSYVDAYSGAAAVLTAGANQSLGAYGYRVLTNANVPVVAVTGVSLTGAATVSAGLTTQFTAVVAPTNATNQVVSYASSNTGIASVNGSGLVTGVNAGTTTITVTTQDGNKTATAPITVTAASNFVVHFYRPANWGTGLKIYYWNTLPSGVIPTVNYPGVNMTAEGDGWYNFTFTNVNSTNLIFNDGTGDINKTPDLSRSSTGWYFNGSWYNTKPNTQGVRSPFAGVIAIPGTIEAENFDNGGEGVAYHDNDAGNRTLVYRNEGVDIESCSEGGYNLNYSNNGEWTEYTVNVASTGSYNIATRVATPVSGGSFHIEMDGVNITGTLTVPNTGGWQNWVDVNKVVTLNAGQHVMRFYIETKEFNTHKFVVTPATQTSATFAIRNRWKQTYLYDAGANVGYGANVANNNYKWQKVAIAGTNYFQLKNVGTGEYMHIENQTGSVQCNVPDLTWWSTQWTQEATEASFVRFRNRWQPANIIHVENQTGAAQYANAQDGWYSAQWELVPQ